MKTVRSKAIKKPIEEKDCGEIAERARKLYKGCDMDTLCQQGIDVVGMASAERRLANNRRSARGSKVFERVLEGVRGWWIETVVEERGKLKGEVGRLEGEVGRLREVVAKLRERIEEKEEKEREERVVEVKEMVVDDVVGVDQVDEGVVVDKLEVVVDTNEDEGKDCDDKNGDDNGNGDEVNNTTSVFDPLLSLRCSEEADGDFLGFLNSQGAGGSLFGSQGFGSQGFGACTLSQGLV